MSNGLQPIPMILHCPVCHMQHVDEVDETTNPGWTNPTHTSHKCLGCGTIWRPCARPTEGVRYLEEHGRSDTWPALGRRPKPRATGCQQGRAMRYLLRFAAFYTKDMKPRRAMTEHDIRCRENIVTVIGKIDGEEMAYYIVADYGDVLDQTTVYSYDPLTRRREECIGVLAHPEI